mmetsp:Transcript_8969/g.26882  ORF Transcript_8969/g.26882 Transcript_8969/m.26882 type:complete len:148 (-) Transcript_8969:275-718(-)
MGRLPVLPAMSLASLTHPLPLPPMLLRLPVPPLLLSSTRVWVLMQRHSVRSSRVRHPAEWSWAEQRGCAGSQGVEGGNSGPSSDAQDPDPAAVGENNDVAAAAAAASRDAVAVGSGSEQRHGQARPPLTPPVVLEDALGPPEVQAHA